MSRYAAQTLSLTTARLAPHSHTQGRHVDLSVNMYSVGLAGEPAIGSRGGGGPKIKEVYHYHVKVKGIESRSSADTGR